MSSSTATVTSQAEEEDGAIPSEQETGDGGEEAMAELSFKKHVKYFKRVLAVLPCSLASLDSNRF